MDVVGLDEAGHGKIGEDGSTAVLFGLAAVILGFQQDLVD